MSDLALRRRIETILRDAIIVEGAHCDDMGCIYLADDDYGVEDGYRVDTITVRINRLAEAIADELERRK